MHGSAEDKASAAATLTRGESSLPDLAVEIKHGNRVTSPKGAKTIIFYFFDIFLIYLAPSGAKYCEKGWAATKIGEG